MDPARTPNADRTGTVAVMSWWWSVLIGFGELVASWAVLVVLARRPPPGVLRELAGFIPNCVLERLLGPARVRPDRG